MSVSTYLFTKPDELQLHVTLMPFLLQQFLSVIKLNF